MSRPTCLLIGAQPHAWTTISLACLKAAADAAPALQGRIDVEILNFVAPTSAQVVEAIARRRPDVVGFSCYLWNTAVFFDALKAAREAVPGAFIVLGGPDVYPQARRVLEAHPEADAVVVGEGEVVFPRLLAARLDGAPWRELPGLAFLRDGEFFQTPEAPQIKDLDSLPSPILGGALPLPDDVVRITLETSRGCPFDCSFCDWPGRSQKPRTRSVDRVIAELAYVVANAKNLFMVQFADSDIFLDKPRVKELLLRAREVLAGTNVILFMELYLGRLDEELMRAVDFPNFFLSAGVQTATPEALKTTNRFFHREKIEAAVLGVRALAPLTRLGLEIIYPLPGDTLEGFLDTYEWVLSLRPEMVGAYPALVLPGADMGQHPERYDFEYSDRSPRRIVSLPRFPAADVRRANARVFRATMMQRAPFVRNTLAHLAEPGGRKGRPFLALYEEFGSILEREGVLPPETASDGVEDVFAAGSMLGHDLMRDGAKLERAMSSLALFASSVLRDQGRADRLPVFERYWSIESQFLRWIHSARAASGDLTVHVDADVRRARRLLWLGLESLTEERPLPRRAEGRAEIVHVMSEGTRPYHCLEKVRHAGFEELERGAAPGERADALVLSHLFTRSSPAEREILLSYASRAADAGARLILWDGLLGRSPLESLRPKTDADWERPAPAWDAAAVEREFAAHGWAPEAAPGRHADSHRFSFVRA